MFSCLLTRSSQSLFSPPFTFLRKFVRCMSSLEKAKRSSSTKRVAHALCYARIFNSQKSFTFVVRYILRWDARHRETFFGRMSLFSCAENSFAARILRLKIVLKADGISLDVAERSARLLPRGYKKKKKKKQRQKWQRRASAKKKRNQKKKSACCGS